MIIVIDGPAGSGKSSTAKAVAKRMQIEYLDSGALYRALTWMFIQAGKNEKAFFELLSRASISFAYNDELFHVEVNGEDITSELRSSLVSNLVSQVASDSRTRMFVNNLMREAVTTGHYIAEGRDLGTAVFPEADLKFYMVADVEERARRRFEERKAAGDEVSLTEVQENIRMRDEKDSKRKADPLRKAEDAIELNTTEMSFDEQVQKICTIIEQKTELSFKS